MPEGDTIHAAARRLGIALEGKALVEMRAPRLAVRMPAPGAIVGPVEARGKHLLIHLSDGHVLHTHMRMTGSWVIEAPGGDPRGVAVIEVPDAVAVCRRAPIVELLDEAAVRRHPVLRALGPDLTVPGVDLDDALQRLARIVTAGTSVGDALLDQRPAAGIGNVIMQEACFLVGIDPRTPIERVGRDTRRALLETASQLLVANVATSRRTTVPGGRPGTLWVYGRDRRGCRRCGTSIAFARSSRDARPTWWCPSCQPEME